MTRLWNGETATIVAKPCPFCGSTRGFVERMDTCVYRYHCDCAAEGPPVEHGRYADHEGKPANDAIRAWNRRAPARSERQRGARS